MSYGIVKSSYDKECCFVDSIHVPDGEGGTNTEWADGAKFMASIVPQTSGVDRIAEQLTGKTVVQISTSKSVKLDALQVIRCEDNYYQVTTDEPKETPDSSPLDMRQVMAKNWVMPHD